MANERRESMNERTAKPVSVGRLRLRLYSAKRDLISMAEEYAEAGGHANWECVLAAKAALDKARAESEKQ